MSLDSSGGFASGALRAMIVDPLVPIKVATMCRIIGWASRFDTQGKVQRRLDVRESTDPVCGNREPNVVLAEFSHSKVSWR
jgi:hypothetical protein